MPEEKPLIIDPILTQLSRLDEKLADAGRADSHHSVQAALTAHSSRKVAPEIPSGATSVLPVSHFA